MFSALRSHEVLTEDLGTFRLKGLETEIRAYRVRAEALEPDAES